MKRWLLLLALAAAACSSDISDDKLIATLNERASLVAHIGRVTKVDVLSTSKAATNVDGVRSSCEVRLMHVTGKKGSTYVSYMRRETPAATDSALTWSDERGAADTQLGKMLSQHCNT